MSKPGSSSEESSGDILRLRRRIAELEEQCRNMRDEPPCAETEEQYRQLVQALPDVVYHIDQHGMFTFINDAVGALGYKPEELIGKHFSSIVHPEDVEHISRARLLPVLEGTSTGEDGAPRLFDERRTGKRRTRDLSVRLLVRDTGDGDAKDEYVATVIAFGEVSAAGTYDHASVGKDRRFLGTTGIIRDITERRRAQQRLRDSERELRRILDRLPDTYYRTGLDGVISLVSPAITEVAGFSPDEVVGRNITDFYVDPDARRTFLARLEAEGGHVRNHHTELRRKGGGSVWVSTNAHVLRDDNGAPIGVEGTARDISDLKAAERALHESQERLRLARFTLDQVRVAAFWFREDATIADANEAACAMFGYTREQLLTRTAFDLAPETDRNSWQRSWAEHMHGKRSTFETVFLHTDSSKIPVEVTRCGFEFEGRALSNALVRDIRERKALEAHILQSQKMEAVGHLAGGVAHEFNNLLMIVKGAAHLLGKERDENAGESAWLQTILDACARGALLTDQLLCFSRHEQSPPKPVSLHAVVEQAVALLKSAMNRAIDLRLNLEAASEVVRGDTAQLEQAMINLGVNADRAMPAGGTLEFSTSNPDAGTVELRVSDGGCGISPDLRGRIFDPFFTTREVGQGAGLGLAQVYGTMQAHGGDIRVESAVGRGTTFILTFNAVAQPAAVDVSPAAG